MISMPVLRTSGFWHLLMDVIYYRDDPDALVA